MAEGKTPKNASELLKALHEFVLGPEEAEVTALPPEEVQAALRVEGMDTTPLVRHVRERLSKIRAQDELSRARIERDQLLQHLQSYRDQLTSAHSRVKEQILERLNHLLVGRPSEAQAYFRKFEETSEADMHSLLQDLKILDEMGNDHADGPRALT
jgi:hypothetical protein